MNRDDYLHEVSERLTRMFRASREGYKAPAPDRHRLEGFMQAGVFMGLVSQQELAAQMEAIHQQIFGKSIAERKAESAGQWEAPETDYSRYETPAFERRGGQSGRQ
ncbi:hypothetical protein ACQUQU_10860 [Thalassolituus sp. LLYu03]|uniref:hypothetical protein n=1 Tax=Thalassolituus sp. LLYu03 TaxID=3421656 RepID=UPI003D296571